jgi:hypothetical protein
MTEAVLPGNKEASSALLPSIVISAFGATASFRNLPSCMTEMLLFPKSTESISTSTVFCAIKVLESSNSNKKEAICLTRLFTADPFQ